MKHDPALARKLYRRPPSRLEETLALHLRSAGLKPDREYKFHPSRKWRADFAFIEQKILIEAEGGTFSGGRHTTGSGFEKDAEKYNTATLMGWRVLRFTARMIQSGQALQTIEQALNETPKTTEP